MCVYTAQSRERGTLGFWGHRFGRKHRFRSIVLQKASFCKKHRFSQSIVPAEASFPTKHRFNQSAVSAEASFPVKASFQPRQSIVSSQHIISRQSFVCDGTSQRSLASAHVSLIHSFTSPHGQKFCSPMMHKCCETQH